MKIQNYESFRKKIEELINKHSMENGSDTQDFILADYLTGCLMLFDKTLQLRNLDTEDERKNLNREITLNTILKDE